MWGDSSSALKVARVLAPGSRVRCCAAQPTKCYPCRIGSWMKLHSGGSFEESHSLTINPNSFVLSRWKSWSVSISVFSTFSAMGRVFTPQLGIDWHRSKPDKSLVVLDVHPNGNTDFDPVWGAGRGPQSWGALPTGSICWLCLHLRSGCPKKLEAHRETIPKPMGLLFWSWVFFGRQILTTKRSSLWDTCGLVPRNVKTWLEGNAEASAMAWWMQLRKEGEWSKAHSALHGLGDNWQLM